ncbi:Pycsar system effector family protein [Streptomyces sp. NBC_00690]|uniref:Pycsar system effector family protein n=1 Tax=Streptomyces sp. NBC_00690 TaxID=2975808 RepID=UPI002E2E13C9|nr:Pycsar system effector family protein [Streptomyces sp. NBC_00690]
MVAYNLAERKLGTRGAEMFMEVQRADGKAAALCAVAGGLLAVAGAGMSGLAANSGLLMAVLACSCVLLGSALVAALLAIRPVLPSGRALTGLERVSAGSAAEEIVAAFHAMSCRDHLQLEADRLSLLAGLAARKFWAIKVSVDLIVAAILVAGIGLLITYVTA